MLPVEDEVGASHTSPLDAITPLTSLIPAEELERRGKASQKGSVVVNSSSSLSNTTLDELVYAYIVSGISYLRFSDTTDDIGVIVYRVTRQRLRRVTTRLASYCLA
jgi:hypothetical protein